MTKPHQPLFVRLPAPAHIRKIHVLGVAGSAMGAFACMLQEAGYEVRGSDLGMYPPMSDMLAARGVGVSLGWDPAHLDWGPDWVIVGNVCRQDNPVAAVARARGVPYASFPQAVSDLFLARRSPVVVTGTHGKTTTTNLTAHLLRARFEGVGLLAGGVGANFGSPYVIGAEGAPFVIEGDEYDTAFFDKGPKFLHYRPEVAVVNNIEFDHADIYDSVEEIEENFARLCALITPGRLLLVNGDDPRALGVARAATGEVVTYGFGEGCAWRATEVSLGPAGAEFLLTPPASAGAPAWARSPLPGRYNVGNALAALAAAVGRYGVPLPDALAALASFRGVQKRQEVVADVGGVLVMEDYANHPTAAAETLRGLRAQHPGRRLWAIYEPKSNTARRRVHQEEYAAALAEAPLARLTRPFKKEDRFPAAERLDLDALVGALRARGVDAAAWLEIDELVDELAREARAGDLLVFMSSSHFEGGVTRTVERLRAREEAARV
ncbi:MAG: hypothetical protein FJ138_09915 [Deltaproteobacteria bacterium]|nr:hypothetical protein [Deltaproteobacteria bacterium]